MNRIRLANLTAVILLLTLVWTCAATRCDEPPSKKELTAEQKEKLKERDRYAQETTKLRQQGNLPEAITAAEKMLAIERDVFGNVHEDVAGSLQQLAEIHAARANFAAAKEALQEVLGIKTKLFGQTHWQVTDARQALASLEVISRLSAADRRQLAEAARMNGLLGSLYRQGKFQEALKPAQEAVRITKQLLGERHPNYATSVNELAFLYKSMGDYAKAEPLYRQALEIRKQVQGEKHPNYAAGLNNLAKLYDSMGDYAKAEPLFRQALEIYKQVLGEKHPLYALCLGNLGAIYHAMGDYDKAEPLFQQALDIRKQVQGEKHPDYAGSLNNLAALYRSMGDYAKAEPLFRQALDIRKQVQGEKHPDYAQSLHNLAALYRSLGDNAPAELLYRQALDIRKQVLGDKHPDYAQSLDNLAVVYFFMGDYVKAELFGRQALDIRKQALGEKHPAYAGSLHNLAVLYENAGDYAKAVPLYLQALETYKQMLGEKHPDYARSLGNLAGLYDSMGDHAQAEPLCRQALQISRRQMELTAPVQSERQQLQMIDNVRFYLDAYLSFSEKAPIPAEQVYAEVLSWKGSVTARQQSIRRVRLALQKGDPEVAKRYAELEQATRKLATLSRASPDAKNPDQLRHDLESLSEEVERLQKTLAGVSADFRRHQEQRRRTAEDIRKMIPADTVLVDLLVYKHLSPPKSGKGKRTEQIRAIAFVSRPDRPVQRLDLGPVEPIAQAITAWRKGFGMVGADRGPGPGAELRKLVWEPLQPHVRGAKTVLISPDGVLARFPWAALPGQEPNSYLIEEIGIAVVPVPQLVPELLAEGAKFGEPSLLLVGDVDFDAAPGKPVQLVSSKTSPRRKRGSGLDKFAPLTGTIPEILTIRDWFEQWQPHKSVKMLRKGEATERAVRDQAPKHRYLHFATHGYFAPPQLRSALAAASKASQPLETDFFYRRDISGFHPGLLSGIVLAGANQAVDPSQDDGILTALEVAELDLGSVELATLSACETGLGETAGGEGLLGLQRAFQVAGARSVVATLWQVQDDAARALMIDFYENLWNKKVSKVEALRQAQLKMLREGISRGLVFENQGDTKRRSPPKFWAAFVLSGDWR